MRCDYAEVQPKTGNGSPIDSGGQPCGTNEREFGKRHAFTLSSKCHLTHSHGQGFSSTCLPQKGNFPAVLPQLTGSFTVLSCRLREMISVESTMRYDWQNKSIAAKRESINHLQGVLGSWQPGAPIEEIQGPVPALNQQPASKVCRAK